MPTYRKNPLLVEAIQWFPEVDIPGVLRIPANKVDMSGARGIIVDRPERHVVNTHHGQIELAHGDWIITGLNGEKYPCRPDVFDKTYQYVSPFDTCTMSPHVLRFLMIYMVAILVIILSIYVIIHV